MNLLTKGSDNHKLKKNTVRTYIMYMSPHKNNSMGKNICPKASKGCAAACLFTAGYGAYERIKNKRKERTEFFLKDKKAFYEKLATEIMNKVNYARRKGERIAFRLNGTSDLDHVYSLKKYAGLDIKDLQDVTTFYDYTKIPQKALKYKDHPNYHITFSRSEENEKECEKMLKEGVNVTVVFRTKKESGFPKTYKGYEVISGEKDDMRFLDSKGYVVGLTAKGKAMKDDSGFVVNI